MKTPTLMFGVPIDDLTMSETVDHIAELVDDGRRNSTTHQIATVNVDFLVNALDEPSMRHLLQRTTLNLPDGLPIVWGASLARLPIRERVTGADLVPRLAAEAGRRGWHIHFFGSAPDVADRALTLLRRAHPHARITAESGPRIDDVTQIDDAVLDEIMMHDPDILCVALGNPKQERFIAAHRERLGVPVMVGVGGSLDMLVGDKRRAPGWAQRAGAEWVFRAAQEPRRLGPRYARDARVFGPKLVSYVRELHRHRNGPGLMISSLDHRSVRIEAARVRSTEAPARTWAHEAVTATHLEIDFARTVPHPQALATLVGVIRAAGRTGACSTSVSGVDRATYSALSRLGLSSWIEPTPARVDT